MNHVEMMRLAESVALRSVCKRAQVGAVLAHGWVTFKGFNHNVGGGACECDDGKTLDTVVHAERMALNERARYLSSPAYDMSHLKNVELHSNCGVLYVTRQPCINCAKLIVNAGIGAVYYRDPDDKRDGLDWLVSHGVAVNSGWLKEQMRARTLERVQRTWADRWQEGV